MGVRVHSSWSFASLVLILTTVTAFSNPSFRSGAQNAGCSHPPALVERGDCEYYNCMENSMKCGDTGFLRGFGHRYCTKIDQHRNSFSTEGKKWAEEVKKCVIRETAMALAFRETTCYSLMEDGLYRIGQCYVSSQPSFCKILQNTRNHQVLAQIMNVADLPGEESEFVVHQISDSARSCMHSKYTTSLGNINTVRDNIRQFIQLMTDQLPTTTTNAQQVTLRNGKNVEAECQTFLATGDCRFFECFERKFPCAGSIDASHVMHFELPTCQDMTSYIGLTNSHKASTWAQDYHKCLMNELRPLYNSNSITCASLHAFMSDKRQACMINAEMCLIKPEDFSLTLDQATNMETYPNSVPMRMLQEKLTRSHFRLPNYYYRHLGALRGQFGDALCQCRARSDGSCPPLYKKVHNRDGESFFVMNTYHPRKTGDADCEALGGRCESVLSSCAGNITPKICDGPANRVCVRSGSKREKRVAASKREMPNHDGKLNLYVLPTGQGDAHILQCPKGELTIIDLGGHRKKDYRFWKGPRVKEFLAGKDQLIRNIVISHNDVDHYNLFRKTFDKPPCGLKNVYISCTLALLPDGLKGWINSKPTTQTIEVKNFNNGEKCGTKGVPCGNFGSLCPNDPDVKTQVLAANLGGCRANGLHKNVDSLLFKVILGTVSVLMPGDFEDETESKDATGSMKDVIDNYNGRSDMTLKSTVYKVAHHGADGKANKPMFREAIGPKAVIASAMLGFSTYYHPRCASLKGYTTLVRSDQSSGRQQSPYVCYDTPQEKYVPQTNNQHSIYTTNPDRNTVNLIKFSTDGTTWGIELWKVD